MANILIQSLDSWAVNRASRLSKQFNIGQFNLKNLQWNQGRPNWVSLSEPEHFEQAARTNPIVKAAINLLAVSASNGKKIAIDIATGDTIPWTDTRTGIKEAYKLLTLRPNPLQSAKEFAYQGMFYLKVFGNRYVYVNMPTGFNKEIDLLNISTLMNLPSQFVSVKTTGKLYDQTTISGIIKEYALNNEKNGRTFRPEEILHFNEVNFSKEMASIMGTSKLEAIRMPITNTQKAFEAMNTLLTSRGAQGIISPKNKDGMGISVPMTDTEKKEVDDTFKKDYGLLNNQNPFLISPISMEYEKTTMSSSELGIYEEFSNNAILIGNEFGVPPELIKTYIQGATYENQIQSVRRLYQDTTIPMVEDQDSYWSYMLNSFKYGFEIQTSWDHIPALQAAFKDKAEALNLNGRAANAAYKEDVIWRNQYLEFLGLPPVEGSDVYKSEWDKKKQNQ